MLYTPAHFSVGQRSTIAALMRSSPLATVITPGAGEPIVSHIPLLLVEDGDSWSLLGHVARANPHWEMLRGQPSALAIFHGGDAYISPRLYSTRKAVPTWNYAVVHVHGTVETVHDSEAKERVLKALIDCHDRAYRQQWDELDLAFREGMKSAIVAITMAVERIDAKFKLGQNRPADDRARVLETMRAGGDKERMLAAWTEQLAEEPR